MLDFFEGLANGAASCLPPIFGVLLNPRGPKVMEGIVCLGDGTDVSAQVEKDGLYGTGTDIDAEE
jgi:hypothetical protein